jgi:hypothetical protein
LEVIRVIRVIGVIRILRMTRVIRAIRVIGVIRIASMTRVVRVVRFIRSPMIGLNFVGGRGKGRVTRQVGVGRFNHAYLVDVGLLEGALGAANEWGGCTLGSFGRGRRLLSSTEEDARVGGRKKWRVTCQVGDGSSPRESRPAYDCA